MRNSSSAAVLVLAALGVAITPDVTAGVPPKADTYTAECGDCHVAYPAKMLTPGEWKQVLAQLDEHYGVDASLDPATAAAIGDYLRAQTPTRTTARPPQALPRITTQPWFREEHDELFPGALRSATVRSAANCSACHPRADKADFDEHAARIPR